MLSLADFIEHDHDAILAAWEEHARTLLPSASGPTRLLLRDHVTELLTAVVADLRSQQSAAERVEKSKGRGAPGPLDRVGALHSQARGEKGLRLTQIVSEYRALRASVLRLWEDAGGGGVGVGRFNEAIDQVIIATIEHYINAADHYRDQSLGILGHDLRNPLNAVIAGATLLAGDTLTDDAQRHDIARRVVSSGKRMNRMIEDLLDLTRTRFGDAIPIAREPVNLESLGKEIVAEHASQHPAGVRFVSRGDLHGEWDPDRLAQVISNLVRNAIDHGSPDAPVTLSVLGRRDDVVLEVHNRGRTIPASALESIFDPMVPRPETSKHPGLGLGLYIAWHVVDAHGGDIHVTSTDEDGTRFSVRLPRRARAEQHASPS